MSALTRNPDYNNALGAAIQTSPPPFDLEGVIMRVFPLRASFNSLQIFCNRYLNIAPKYAWFEPVAPFVILGVINYGRMGVVSSSYSYTSQNEVLFGVPLNWYEVRCGRRILKGPASVTPFIWVDEPSSLWTGREVFGWPKNMAWLTPGVDPWIKDPRSPRTLFALSTKVFRDLFAGQRQEPQLMIEIEEEQPPALLDLPPNPFNELNPLLAWPKSFLNALRVGGDLLESTIRLPMRGFPELGDKTASLWEMMSKAFGSFDIFRRLPPGNTINLKQFRHPQAPTFAAYQALVNSQMTPTSFNRGSVLGEAGLLRGDFGGGYRIRIHHHPGWPIIETLGLEVSEESHEAGRSVAVLEPVFPFWLDVDFEYGKGEVICWRTQQTHWAPSPRTDTPPVQPDPRLKTGSKKAKTTAPRQCECETPHLYNVAEGGAIQQVYPPFFFSNVTTRVLPLLACSKTLRKFCDNYLNNGRTTDFNEKQRPGYPTLTDPESEDALAKHLFVPWGNYVYMIVSSFEEVTSEVNIGWWARRRVAFSFPVCWYKWNKKNTEWEWMSVGLVSPFMFADTAPAATTGREMQGWPVAEAQIESPTHNWLNDRGPVSPEDLLTLRTNVTPALNANQKTQTGLLVEVTGRDPLEETDLQGWRQIAAEWGEELVKETIRKANWSTFRGIESDDKGAYKGLLVLKSLGMEILGNGAPINHLSMKQFRDAEDPSKACFQAINLYPETLRRVHDLREIDRRLHVAIHRYPTQPIVKALGLQVKWTDSSKGQAIDYLQPIRPFWFRADIKSDLGRDILWRSGSENWFVGDTPFESDTPSDFYFDHENEWPMVAPNYAEWFDKHPHKIQDFKTKKVQNELYSQTEYDLKELFEEIKKPQSQKEEGQKEEMETQEILTWVWRNLGRDIVYGEFLGRDGWEPQIAIESVLSKRWLNLEKSELPEGLADFLNKEGEILSGEGTTLKKLKKIFKKKAPTPPWDKLKEELQKYFYKECPDTILRKDTIGHPEVRNDFEKNHELKTPSDIDPKSNDTNHWVFHPDPQNKKK